MNTFEPQVIKDLRIKSGMSQKDLGAYLGVTDRAVSKWETGLANPSAQNILYLSKIFNVSVESFFSTPSIKRSVTFVKGMESLRELYKVGRGPSSSHTLGPQKACTIFKKNNLMQITLRLFFMDLLQKPELATALMLLLRRPLLRLNAAFRLIILMNLYHILIQWTS